MSKNFHFSCFSNWFVIGQTNSAKSIRSFLLSLCDLLCMNMFLFHTDSIACLRLTFLIQHCISYNTIKVNDEKTTHLSTNWFADLRVFTQESFKSVFCKKLLTYVSQTLKIHHREQFPMHAK
ncbi:hypothetical protein T4B_5221 [Trichinella pseudospiralis]|uniref:Uncharacterized protein n=1 Tax=Trichinella pseudospiralis TaxID=6337 RepID=A0A0V1K0F7_TRIPS|nr:hypothetical protein T4B_5221 [Trichinella pseudospiralis]KRZ40614.1 hypothetical protein T4C_11339 [Trichinella pseudospiralis]